MKKQLLKRRKDLYLTIQRAVIIIILILFFQNFFNINTEASEDVKLRSGSNFTVEELQYQVFRNEEVQVVGLATDIAVVNIPNVITYNGQDWKVTRIAMSAFAECNNITNIIIPQNVTTIEDSAFEGCSNLISITIPEGVTTIGWNAFGGCKSLTSITIPKGVTSLQEYVFYGCTGLTNITIPEGMTEIGNGIFSGCTGLTSIIIPESVTSIGNDVFYNCSKLVIHSNNNAYAHSYAIENGIKWSPFANLKVGDTFVVDELEYRVIKNGEAEVSNLALNKKKIDIPSVITYKENNNEFKVTGIGDNAFCGHYDIISITMPDSLTYIGQSSFEDCYGLTSITIPKSVTSIGRAAFAGCAAITSLTIPENVKSIERSVFSGCCGLTSITIPERITSIGEHAFSGCDSLTEIKIPKNVVSIGEYAFFACSSLTKITIPKRVEKIENALFAECKSLTSIDIPDNVTSIGEHAFRGSGLVNIKIPESITNIGLYAFVGCNNLLIRTDNVYVRTYATKNSLKWKPLIRQISETSVTLSQTSYTYDGTQKQPFLMIKDGNKYLELDTDYTIKYKNNINVGTATITVTGIDNYTGTIIRTFSIKAKKIGGTTAKLTATAYSYTGNAKTPSVTIKDNGKILEKNKDYTVSYKNNKAIGTATVTATGKGNYTGTKILTFKINPAKVNSLKQSAVYSTKSIKMSWAKVTGAAGYTVYRSATKNGDYKLIKTVTTNTCTNSGLYPGQSYYYKVRAYKTVNGQKIHGAFSDIKCMVTKPSESPYIYLVAVNKQVEIMWTSVLGVDGYEIYMSTSKNGTFTKIKTANLAAVNYTKKGLKKGQKYYFKARTYKTNGAGVKVYSKWSNVRAVTIN